MSSGFSRRQVLGWGALVSALALTPGQLNANGASKRRGRPKNIIFCVSDGMSWGVPALLNHYLQLYEGKASSVWSDLMDNPNVTHGMQDTRSLSSLVTDSSAASSAWGSGSYVWNRMLNMLPDGTKLRPILPILKEEAKMMTGVVTTATVTHATPAGWLISNQSREKQGEIAAQYLESGVSVILGGGRTFFPDDLIAKYKSNGFTFAANAEEMRATKAGKALGLFSNSHIPYEVDRRNDFKLRREVPSLAEMTEKAISLLSGSPHGFCLQVEGARIDHAAHGNDMAGALYDQLAFEEALEVALKFAMEDGETLVIATSDHGNSNPGLIGAGSEYFDSTAGLGTLKNMRESYEVLMPKLTAAKTPEEMSDLVDNAFSIKLSVEERELAWSGVKNQSGLKKVDQYQIPSSVLSLALSNSTHVCWSGRQHSTDYMPLTAIGPGHELFGGLQRNTSIFQKLLRLKGVKFTNPSMSWEDAHKIKERVAFLDEVPDTHWMA